mmetsp:Transcript_12649/g.38103  ORF Transcript_12649/g.38103 Transcript_12649/m.38103 type:complete len:490 (-) Transcript_12649:4633-6102(-)
MAGRWRGKGRTSCIACVRPRPHSVLATTWPVAGVAAVVARQLGRLRVCLRLPAVPVAAAGSIWAGAPPRWGLGKVAAQPSQAVLRSSEDFRARKPRLATSVARTRFGRVSTLSWAVHGPPTPRSRGAAVNRVVEGPLHWLRTWVATSRLTASTPMAAAAEADCNTSTRSSRRCPSSTGSTPVGWVPRCTASTPPSAARGLRTGWGRWACTAAAAQRSPLICWPAPVAQAGTQRWGCSRGSRAAATSACTPAAAATGRGDPAGCPQPTTACWVRPPWALRGRCPLPLLVEAGSQASTAPGATIRACSSTAAAAAAVSMAAAAGIRVCRCLNTTAQRASTNSSVVGSRGTTRGCRAGASACLSARGEAACHPPLGAQEPPCAAEATPTPAEVLRSSSRRTWAFPRWPAPTRAVTPGSRGGCSGRRWRCRRGRLPRSAAGPAPPTAMAAARTPAGSSPCPPPCRRVAIRWGIRACRHWGVQTLAMPCRRPPQ